MSSPKAPTIAPTMVLTCTELKAKPKAMIRKSENITPPSGLEAFPERSRRGRRTGPVVALLEELGERGLAKPVAMPTSAITHIQKIAPGPLSVIATATPAMLPVPTRAASEVHKAWKDEMPEASDRRRRAAP